MIKFKKNIRVVFRRYGSFIFLLLVFLGLSSCLPDSLELEEVPEVRPEIVVATQIIPDQSLFVLLTKTFGALEANGSSDPKDLLNQIAVNDAMVTISGPSGTDTLPYLEKGLYGGEPIPFRAGEVYELKVQSESMGEVYASTMVKPQVKFRQISAKLFYDDFNDTLAHISYSIQDPEERNWYMINVQEVEQEDILRNAINPRSFTLLKEDTFFDKPLFNESFQVFTRDYTPGDTIAVSLSSISEEYYRFVKLRLDNRLSFIEFLSEPVDYPSNVVGGKGFFNLYIPDFHFFVLE